MVAGAPGVELAAVVDPDPEARRYVEATPGYGVLEEALSGVECDAVLVASPPGSHHAVARAALEAGKHVLCEKPLATGLEDALELVEAAVRAERVLMVSQNYRYNAPFRAVQRLVMEGVLGELASSRISCKRNTRMLFPPEDFRYSMRHPYVLDMSIHHFDLIRAATGRDVRGVYARSWRVPDSPFVHHPAVAAILSLEGDVPVLYEGDWATLESETSWNGEWEVVGEAGRLLWSGSTGDGGGRARKVGRGAAAGGSTGPRVRREGGHAADSTGSDRGRRAAGDRRRRQREEPGRHAWLRKVHRERRACRRGRASGREGR